MVNEDFTPKDDDEVLLELLKEHNRATPQSIREDTGLNKSEVDRSLDRLLAAGWVRRVSRGLYELVADPRD